MLLVAVDIEGCAWTVVEQAAVLAAELDQPVHLTTAVEVPAGVPAHAHLHGDYEGKDSAQVLFDDAEAALDSLAEVFRSRGVPVGIGVRAGAPVAAILECARELRPRILVLGTHGRTGLKRLVLGSVAERILRQSPVPVLVIPGGEVVDQPTAARRALRAEADG